MKTTPQQQKMLELNIPIHEIIQGEVLTEIVYSQQTDTPTEYERGYVEALQKIYTLVYALVFAKEDLQKKEVSND